MELAELYAADLDDFCSSYGLTEEVPGEVSDLVPASLTIASWKPDEGFNARQWRLTLSDGSDARFVQAVRQHAEGGGNYSTLRTQYIEMVAMEVPESAGFVSRLVIARAANRTWPAAASTAAGAWPRACGPTGRSTSSSRAARCASGTRSGSRATPTTSGCDGSSARRFST
jgi:hypothetical protein